MLINKVEEHKLKKLMQYAVHTYSTYENKSFMCLEEYGVDTKHEAAYIKHMADSFAAVADAARSFLPEPEKKTPKKKTGGKKK